MGENYQQMSVCATILPELVPKLPGFNVQNKVRTAKVTDYKKLYKLYIKLKKTFFLFYQNKIKQINYSSIKPRAVTIRVNTNNTFVLSGY